MHKLLTEGLKKKIPGPRAQENADDPIIYGHYFSCRNGWDWFVQEAWQVVVDANTDEFIEERQLSAPLNSGEKVEDVVFFGLVRGAETEFGPFTLSEFEEANERFAPGGRGLLAVERDMHWTPKPLSEVKRTRGIV
jgi:hypothetical protein